MATEEEAREAAEGKEVQVKAVDLGPFHMQTHMDSKLSLMEIKNVGEIIDSTEGTLKVQEDQILVEAPSEINHPPEHNLNGTSSSLNGHMDEENKSSNEQMHEDSKKDHEQVEAASDGESTDQNNKINKEANDCVSHGELKHEKEEDPKGDDQQDQDPMPDTLKTDSDIDQSLLVVDQLDHNMDPAKATKDTQPASMSNIPNVEVVTEELAGVQSPLDPNLDDFIAILGTVDGSTETDEADREDDAIHLENRETFPDDTSTAKNTKEVVKAEDEQSKQADATDADAVQEDITKCEETDVSEEIPKSEHADKSTINAHEVFHQEPSEDTNGLAYEQKEQTSKQSSMTASTSDDTTSEHDPSSCEPSVDIRVQNKETLEEMEDAEAVDTEAAMQQSCVAFEEAIPEYHVTTTEQDSVETNNTETAQTRNVKSTPSSEDKVRNGVTVRAPASGSQEVDNAGSTEEIMDNIADNIVDVTDVVTVDEADKEKNMLRAKDIAKKNIEGIESEVTKSTKPVETEDSDQRHVSLLDDSAQEDNTPVSEKQQIGSALEINEIDATRTEALPKESNASFSEEPSPEDYVTESEATCDTKDVNTTGPLEAIEGDKDTKTREISDQNNMDSSGKSTQENNAPESEPTSDIQTEQEQESEEMKDTKLAQVNEPPPEINATVFHKQTQENNPTTSELHVMESEGGVSNIEATEVQATPHQFNGDHPEEEATEETITPSEPQTVEPESVEKMDDIEAIKPRNISQQSILSPSEGSIPEEIAKEDIVTTKPDDGHQQPQDPEIASSSIVLNHEEPTSENNVAVIELNSETQAGIQSAEVMEDTKNVKSDGALAGEAAQEKNVETEAIVDISSVQEPEQEEAKNTEPVETEDNITPSDLPAEMMEKETVEIEAIPHESPVASIREVTEKDILTAIAPHADIQPVLKQESVEDKCTDTTEKPRETQQIIGSASDELIPTEDKRTAMAEPARETPLKNVTAQGITDSEEAQTDQFSNLDSFPTPREAAQESKLPRIEPTSDVHEVQELDSTEEIRGIEAAETEDHQQHRVSTLEPAVDNKPNIDDHQVHEEKPAELKVNEAMEAEQVLEQSNINTPDNAHEERIELGNDPDCCVQPAQQVESSRESEDNKLLNEEETSDQKIITLEDTATEDIAADEIDPSVAMEQEHEQKTVEEVKDASANEAKEDFHTSQPDAFDKPASESNIAETEPTYDIQRLNDFETKEMKNTKGINDGDISSEQTEIATPVDPSPTDNEIALQEHPMESYEEKFGNETENAMLAHGMKGEIQTSAEQKDDAFDLGETVPTTEKSKNLADEDVIESSSEDALESSNSTDQIKEGQNAGIEHNSSQKSSKHHGENIAHVQDKDIRGELVTEGGTTEASQTLIENDAQASQDVSEKDDTIICGEHTNDHRQSGDVDHQPQTCESSVEDEAAQKVSLDERHKEDEEVKSHKEQLQADEQKHKDESDDVGNEPLVEFKNTENATTNRTEETDMLEAGQTGAVVNEILKIEQALHTSEDSTQSITDTTVEDIMGTDKGIEEENRPNSSNTSDADAKMDYQEDQENTGKDDIVPMDSAGEQDGTTDEITNEELEPGLASSIQEKSHTAPSKDHILENDPTAVPYNAESGGHEDKECTNKVNDDLLAIQESEKEIIDGMQENKEMQNEAKAVHHDKSHTKAEEGEMSQLRSNESYDVDTKIDDTAQNTTVQSREIEDIGENKGLTSIYKPVVETSEQHNVEQDLSIHHKLEDEKMESTEDTAVEHKVDISNVDTKNDGQLSIRNSLTKQETESANDVLQLEREGNAFDKTDETVSYEKTEARNTSVPETVTFNEEICDKATGAEGGMSDGSLKTSDDTRRNLDASSVVTALNEESMPEKMEEYKLFVPADTIMYENTPKQEMSLSEKPLSTEPEEQEDDQICKEQDEEDMHESDFGDDQKEVEQDLPVSNFLMNLILGKENGDANGHSEPEAEPKQEETRDENRCLIIPNQEESLALPPTENNVEDKLAVEQEKKDVKCSEETHEVVEEQSHDLKLGTETSLETDVELDKNSHHLELPPYQDKMQDEISNKILSDEAAQVFSKMEDKDIVIPNIKQDDREVDTVCQENTGAATQIENGSLNNNLDDLNNTKVSEEDTLGEGQTGLLPEYLNDDRSVNAVSEQTLLLTEPGMTDAKSLPSEADSVQNPVFEIQDKLIESYSIGAKSIPDIQVETEEDKTGEKQPATTATATGEVAEEHVEISNDNPQKSIGPEATSDKQESQIVEQVNGTEIALDHDKESSTSTFMNKKEDSNVSVKGVDNIQTAVEIQADGSNMQINQDKQEAADNKTEMESEKPEESNIQEQLGNGTEKKSPTECHEDKKFLRKKETVIKEEDAHKTVKSHSETVKIKSNDEQELSYSKVHERDLNLFSPKEVPEPEESFMDITKPEFSTDEKQSPKADESNMSEQITYERKTNDEEIKNFSDEAMKTEAQVTGQKAARKKQNLLSGVGSKVKHQLAKVKKVITGKPGHTKPESPK